MSAQHARTFDEVEPAPIDVTGNRKPLLVDELRQGRVSLWGPWKGFQLGFFAPPSDVLQVSAGPPDCAFCRSSPRCGER
jgi:hypothetical protein